MDITQLKKLHAEFLRQHSGHETVRQHFGMSKIGQCAYRTYLEYRDGLPANDGLLKNFRRGRVLEGEVKFILSRMDALRIDPFAYYVDADGFYHSGSERELIAPWDDRFRGHTDGELNDGSLLEIKSMARAKFAEAMQTHKLPHAAFVQAQLYMRYGGYDTCTFALICPETWDYDYLAIKRIDAKGEQYEERAKRIIAAVDGKCPPPACECGRCGVEVRR